MYEVELGMENCRVGMALILHRWIFSLPSPSALVSEMFDSGHILSRIEIYDLSFEEHFLVLLPSSTTTFCHPAFWVLQTTKTNKPGSLSLKMPVLQKQMKKKTSSLPFKAI